MGKNELPNEVVNALLAGKKIEAIKLLRTARGLGLKEAKELVEYHLENLWADEPATMETGKMGFRKARLKRFFVPGLVLISIVWAMINIPRMVGNVIVLKNQAGYKKTVFTIHDLLYDNDPEAGLLWGFYGSLPDGETLRMCAPELARAKSLGISGLKSRFPAGTKLEVWYNSDVTDTLFQFRTLNIIPYKKDLTSSELKGVWRWITYCLLPLLAVFILASALEKREIRTHLQRE